MSSYWAVCNGQSNEATEGLAKVSGNIFISAIQNDPTTLSLFPKIQIFACNIENRLEYKAEISGKKYTLYLPKGFYEIKSNLYGFDSSVRLLHIQDTTHYRISIGLSRNMRVVRRDYSYIEKSYVEGYVWLIDEQKNIHKMKGFTPIEGDGSKNLLTMVKAVKEDTKETFGMFVNENGYFEGWLPEGNYLLAAVDLSYIEGDLASLITLERGRKYTIDLYALEKKNE